MKLHFIAALAAITVLAGLAPGKANAAPGDLYVSGENSNTIYRVTPGGVVSVFASTALSNPDGDPAFKLGNPQGLAFDASGNLYVAMFGGSAIERFTPGGIGSVFAYTSTPGLNEPDGLAFDASGNLYASSEVTNTIERFTPGGGIGSVFASTGLSDPQGLAFDASGNLYAANFGSNTVERFTPGGVPSVFASTGLNGTTSGPFSNPQGLAFDASGNLYVGKFGSTVDRITPGGIESLFATGASGEGLAFDASGNLYVSNNNDIVRITPGGAESVFAFKGFNVNEQIFGLAFEPGVGPTAVPEPASLAVLAIGAAGLGLTRRKRVRSAGGVA